MYFPMMFFFFNDTAATEIYTLSLHDALPILRCGDEGCRRGAGHGEVPYRHRRAGSRTGAREFCRRGGSGRRSEEHTSELQSHVNLVCRLLLEKKKKQTTIKIVTS